jgi:hypothetical protein
VTDVGASPYSTGGGGVTLEHIYAACLLSALLAGDPITELGDSLVVSAIRLQAGDVSPIDDIVIEGKDSVGDQHRASIGVRRDPALTKSDASSVPLIRDYLRIVTDHWADVRSGVWSMTLAVSTTRPAYRQLGALARLARAPDAASFSAAVARPGATNAPTRKRLEHLEDLVSQAAADLPTASTLSTEELTWRWLSGLKVRVLRLEDTDTSDRTAAISALQRVVADGSASTADGVFSRIAELTGTWAADGAVLTEGKLRRELGNCALKRSPSYTRAWQLLDRLAARLRDSIRPGLVVGSETLELERPNERARLAGLMRSIGASASALVVTGDPDVGKSALALRVLERLNDEGAAAASLSLRDLPSSLTDFESLLGGSSIDAVFSTAEVRPTRLLLIDGSESVLEGKSQVFRALAAAAFKSGIGVVAVTRTDGARQVQEDLIRAGELAGAGTEPDKHVVGPLSDTERQTLPRTFNVLGRLNGDRRADWLLGRPGLVDALLRAGGVVEPTNVLCEADVFSAVWGGLVRRHEQHEQGMASPDDREEAALGVARRTLGVSAEPILGTATAELRSDGVLRVPQDPSLSAGDEFTTDLFRDFALCRLFISTGWEPLAAARAPRWCIRAARLACQASLIRGNLQTTNLQTAWSKLVSGFDQIAVDHGDRWSEVPYEALLTLSDAEAAIRELWASLAADDHHGLKKLLRLAQLHYVNGTIGDPYALAPVVKVAYCGGEARDGGGRKLAETIQEVVLAWLRGMASAGRGPDHVRQCVRDVVLDSDPALYDDFAVEALATLGSDIDDRAESWLREVAETRPSNLDHAVESFIVAVSMSQSRPHLLAELAEAYYIERPDPSRRWTDMGFLDDGIRGFRHGLEFGFGPPQAAWYYGPFWHLLNAVPVEAIAFINRMLDYAAHCRVNSLSRDAAADVGEELEGLDLELPGVGPRRYVGDGHVWAWYRGTSVGPYACMSALLALERFIDHLHEKIGVPAQWVVELLMRDCNNLAIPGMLVGFLTRHPDSVGDLLDPFLASPDVWHLESARVTGDYGFRVRDSDADKLTGTDRRRYTPHETVTAMVVNARIRGNEARLGALEQVGEQLVENARSRLRGEAGDDEYLAMIQGWAAKFRIESYRASQTADGVVIEVERPAQVEQVLAPRDLELQIANTLYGLQNRYARLNDRPDEWPVEELEEDLATARRIADGEVPQDFLWPENGLVAVASAAVRAHALGLANLTSSDLTWSAEAVMWAAEHPHVDRISYYGSMFPMGADRAAAVAAPLLLLAPFDDLGLDRARLHRCLNFLASSLFDEVRMAYARGCEPVWRAPCLVDGPSVKCLRHQPAWDAAAASLADCKLGPWDQRAQRRVPESLPPPFRQTLADVASEDLLVNRLRMPVVCMTDAREVSCIANDVGQLWAPLWDAHRRGLDHWWREGYDHGESVHHEPIARRLVEVTMNGEERLLEAHLQTFVRNAKAMHLLLESLARVFTYDERLQDSLSAFWPWVMGVVLDAVGDGSDLGDESWHWFDYAVAAILPVPQPRSWDPDIDATLERCRRSWIQPSALDGVDERWLRLARWEPKAADAVARFARSAPLAWQTTTALTWIETIIDGRFDLFANHLLYAGEWLSELRRSGPMVRQVASQFHRIVDGLAAAGDRSAVRLQQLDE